MKDLARVGTKLLCCPCCHGELASVETNLICADCAHVYPKISDIPVLVDDMEAHRAMLAEAYEAKPSWYLQEQLPEKNNPWRYVLETRRKYVQSVLNKELTDLGSARFPSILDLGCGDGNNSVWIKSYAEKIYASDYNITRLVRARKHVPSATIFLANILKYPTKANSFSCIYFNHVLEHISEDVAALREVSRILRPNGLLILGIPNEGASFWQDAYRKVPGSLQASDHCQFYTAEEIEQKVTAVGLECLSIRHIGWGPPSWRWEERVNRYKLGHMLTNFIGRRWFEKQSSALYVIARKPAV